MSTPKAKYHLHASKVDRIAIVDNPAVPDAEIVVFKRYTEEVESSLQKMFEKAFAQDDTMFLNFLTRSASAAVDVLQDTCWYAIYGAGEPKLDDVLSAINKAFDTFTGIVTDVLMKSVEIAKANGNADSENNLITQDEVLKQLNKDLAMSEISNLFTYMRNNFPWLVASKNRLENPESVVKEVISVFKDRVTKALSDVIVSKKEDAFEKAGRIISAHRMKKLKEAYKVLDEIIKEVEERYSAELEKRKEDEQMDMKELETTLSSLSTSVRTIVDKQAGIEKALHDAGILMTEEEKAKAAADKAKAEADKATAEKKAKEEQEALEKAEKEKADAIEKSKKEKAEKEEERMKGIEKSIADLKDATDSICKRFSIQKKSMDTEGDSTVTKRRDPFIDTVRGRVEKKKE